MFAPKKYLGLLSMTSLILSFPGAVFANSSSYYEGDGSTILPIENKSIVLKKEIVRIKPDPEGRPKIARKGAKTRWLAACELIFYNKSDAEEWVLMGSPDWLNHIQI